MTRLVAIAITCCPDCSSSYDLEEWRALELRREYTKEDPPMAFEVRVCACGRDVKTRVDGLEDLDLYMSADAYADAFGPVREGKAFELLPSWWAQWRPTLTTIGLMSVALLLVALLVIGVVRVAL